MRLESFRIRNCFGFVDSGEINLGDQGNLTYFLGRNSSGKTSVLRAVSSFEHGLTPPDQPRFENYERPVGQEILCARFSVNLEEKRRLPSAESLSDAVTQRFSNTPLDIRRDDDGFAVTHGGQSFQRVAAFLNHVREVYDDLIEKIYREGQVWIEKRGDGSYRFLTTPDSYEDYEQRKESISAGIGGFMTQQTGGGRNLRVGNSAYQMQIGFEYVEGLLFMQFPEIFLFTEKFSLDEDLPRSIREEHLRGQRYCQKLWIAP